MRAFAAVAFREIAERRTLLLGAAFAATLPLLAPLLPGVPADQGIAARSVTALILAFTFGIGGGTLVGASVVGRELAERRLSFHFSRPIPSPALWAGKLLGGLSVALLAEAIVVLPTSAVIGGIPSFGDAVTDPEFVRGLLFVPVPLYLLAWLGSVALRSRSLWLVVDAVLLASLPAALFVVGRRYVYYGGLVDPERALLAALGIFVVAALAGTFAQVAVGRTDGRRGHGAQSLVLWGLLVAASVGVAAWAERRIDPGVARLRRAWAGAAGSNGDWVNVQGSAGDTGGGSSSYLVNLGDGRDFLLPMSSRVVVSRTGSRAAFIQPVSLSLRGFEIRVLDLQAGTSVIVPFARFGGTDLSPDGRRLALISEGLCRVLELPSLDLAASVRVPTANWRYEPRFLSPGVVRLLPSYNLPKGGDAVVAPASSEDPEGLDLDVATRSVSRRVTYPVASLVRFHRPGEASGTDSRVFLTASPDASKLLAATTGAASSVRVLDAESGAVLAFVDGSPRLRSPQGALLADGRFVLSEPGENGPRLAVHTADGARLLELSLPAGVESVSFGLEVEPGVLALGLGRGDQSEGHRLYLLDLDRKSVRRMSSLALIPRAWWEGRSLPPPPGSPAAHLAYDNQRRIVRYDPVTGRSTPLTRGISPRPAGK